ncbi:MAG TPA: glycosyltransferase [Usitatibacter sp.]|nr:glycosyltransferase [Usitatibacter sp.]
MRILHIGKYYPPVTGGMERFLADLVHAQRGEGHDVRVLVHQHERSRETVDPPWLLRCPVWLKLFFAPIAPRFPFWLDRALRGFDPEVVHIHMPNVSPFWLLVLRSARKRTWVVHWHSDVEPSRFKLSLRLGYPHYRIFERALLEGANSVLVTSRQYLDASKALQPWLHKSHVVPLGVDPARLPDVASSETEGLWKDGGLRVLAVGRLTYYKGFDTLVHAVLGDPAKELVIIGAGEERAALERLLAKAGNPHHIRLTGELDDASVRRYMASCDLLCLPSRERTEAFGIVLLEAMRYGKPIVASDLAGSGVTWVARNGQNAVLVRPDDVLAWRAALNALHAHPGQRALMGRLGRQRYQREFDIQRISTRITHLYDLARRVEIESVAAQALEDDGGTPMANDSATANDGRGRILVVIPALNEADCIGSVIVQARARPATDVIVIDDGSTDDTAAVAALSGALVLRAPLWQGAWGAIQTGIRYAVRHGYSAVITMDADGQHEPAYLPDLVEAGRAADVVIAACASRGSRARQAAWGYFRFLTGLAFDDLTSGFRYYGPRACQLLASEEATLLDYQDIGVLLLLRRANLRISEISVTMNSRKSGASRIFFSWWTVGWYMAETSLLCLARWSRARDTR